MLDFTSRFRNAAPVRLGRAARLVSPALVAAALAAPGCGNDNVTLPDITRAAIEITVDPNPITGTQNSVTGSVSVSYTIVLKEANGLGGEVQFISSAVYEPSTGKQVALNYYDGTDLVVYQGSKRIEPKGELKLPQSTSYTLSDYAKPADLVVSVQFKDDRANLIYSSLLVKIQ
jgi:hypothetical protein